VSDNYRFYAARATLVTNDLRAEGESLTAQEALALAEAEG
jgi:hypothetical protein